MYQSVYSIDIVYTSISIAPLQVLYYSEALPTTARILYRIFTPKRHKKLRVKDLHKVPTRRLERDSNPRPSSHRLNQGATTSRPRPTFDCLSALLSVCLCVSQSVYLSINKGHAWTRYPMPSQCSSARGLYRRQKRPDSCQQHSRDSSIIFVLNKFKKRIHDGTVFIVRIKNAILKDTFSVA